MDIRISLVRFLSKGDEQRFFCGLDGISAIKGYVGSGRELIVKIDRRVLDASMLREFIALLSRYNTDISALSVLASSKKFAWLKDPRCYWYKDMFKEN
ncbi:hypothetical protein [Burkholderia diffusa]|uniref:hypothetical protein n=1 Tax=Burkholderia diffusa TaxID=488732 RepID=UPI0012D935BA|nr:hypothetical protein [Burkholderia diffusa]